jgi:hypothetical protein
MRHSTCFLMLFLLVLLLGSWSVSSVAEPMVGGCYSPIPIPPYVETINWKLRLYMKCDQMTSCIESMVCNNVSTNCRGSLPKPWRSIEAADIIMVGTHCVTYTSSCKQCPQFIYCARMRAWNDKNPVTGRCVGPCSTYVYEPKGPDYCKN